MDNQDYEFAELNQKTVDELKHLEERLRLELGEEITLIAYRRSNDHNDSTCRAGLNE